jgi:hypothetical protein
MPYAPRCPDSPLRLALLHGLALALPLLAPLSAHAQAKAAQQVVKPPVAQLWMDVATVTMPGMPDMPSMPSLGGMLGRSRTGEGSNAFGNTRGMAPGRHVDIAFVTQRQPGGSEAMQSVPAATGLAPSLPLVPVKAEPRGGSPGTPREPGEYEQPKARILFYWGCSETVRAGQPRVLDFSKASPTEWGNFMQGRAPRERGAVARPGNSIWPNDKDRRSFGRDASLAGDHSLSGEGVPADLKFAIGAAHDFMPPLGLTQAGASADVVRLTWPAVPQARAYFINAMSGGQDASGTSELVLWSSAEVPESGMGLIDYASPANIDQWLKEKVLLAPSVTQCAIPRGIFATSQGAMLRMIAYGPELNLAHPPRPTDVKIAWEPEWAVRVRTKSTAMAMLGQSMDAGSRMGAGRSEGAQAAAGARSRPDCPPPAAADGTAAAVGGALGGSVGRAVGGALGGLFGKKEEKKEPTPADCPQ